MHLLSLIRAWTRRNENDSGGTQSLRLLLDLPAVRDHLCATTLNIFRALDSGETYPSFRSPKRVPPVAPLLPGVTDS